MTPKRAAELLPVIQAYAEGKTVQFLTSAGGWVDIGLSPGGCDFESMPNRYRIKPEMLRYRRYVLRIKGGLCVDTAVPNMEAFPSQVQEAPNFVRWIDTEWQEVEV